MLDGRKVTEEELRAHLAQCTDKKAHAAYAKRKRAVAEKAPHSRCNARARMHASHGSCPAGRKHAQLRR